MNESLKSDLLEVVGVNNISYTLKNNNIFSVTGYKVMQNHSNSGLLRCAKIMYNGKIKLIYIIEKYKPLSQVASKLGVSEMNAIVMNLVQRVIDIQANGFFRTDNLELDFNKIFVDTTDYSVYFIYFPIISGATGKITSFENELRVALIKFFDSFPVFNAPQFKKIQNDLTYGSMSLELLIKKLKEIKNWNYNEFQNYYSDTDSALNTQETVESNNKTLFKEGAKMSQPPMTLTLINAKISLVLKNNQHEYFIGKNPSMVNGVVTHNPAISRKHCKITYVDGKYFLTDEGSANGTYVNQKKLEKQKAVEIKNGDCIRLANSDFAISF